MEKAKPRILIVRLSSIGDVLFCTPVAQAVRELYPESYLAWLVEEKSREVVEGNPFIDEVIVWPRLTWRAERAEGGMLRSLWRHSRFIWQLRQRRFDIALDLQGMARSSLVAWVSGAKRRVGFQNAREMAQLLYNEWVTARASAAHISEKYLLVASSLGAGSNKPPMTITFGQADQAASDRLLASVRASGSPDYPLAAFCPSASRTHKLWPPERYAQVANWVSGNLEMLPLFLGGKGDAVYVEEIREACQCPTASLAGQTSLKEAAALLAESRLVIGADTALTHIGAALRRPVVALFGVAGIDYQPRGPLTEVVRSDCRCAPCWARGECAVDYECMLGIQVEQVVGAIRRLVCSSG